jgi:uncharacterized protein (TIGR03435 family)
MPQSKIQKWLTLALLLTPTLHAQYLTFEAASIKPSDSSLGDRMIPIRGGPGSTDPDHVTYTNISLKAMLYYAYGVAGNEIVGPPWLGTPKFDIQATAPPGTTKEQFTTMLRNLLAERFHLAVHHESKEVPGYNLVVGKNGAKLKQSSPEDVAAATQPPAGPPIAPAPDAKGYMQLARPGMIYPSVPGSNGHAIHLIARAQTIPDLARILGGNFQHPIVDKTGLTGRYDFTLEFALENLTPADVPEDLPPRIPAALQDQLGLTLEPTKVSFDQLVVDSADKVPTEN